MIWIAVICILSFIPGNQLPEMDFNWISPDTLAHIFMYLILSFLGTCVLIRNKMNQIKFWLYIVVILTCILFGYLVEIIQGRYIPGRFYDNHDIVSNSIGTIFGTLLSAGVWKKLVKTSDIV